MAFPKIEYTGTTPGTDSNTYNILNSHTSGWPGNWPAVFGVKKVVLDIHHNQAGTLKWYKTQDDLNVATGSVTWAQMGELSVSAPAATAGSMAEVFVEAGKHYKIDWVNGGTAQTTFQVDIALSDERAQI